jgi:hypothetical protein
LQGVKALKSSRASASKNQKNSTKFYDIPKRLDILHTVFSSCFPPQGLACPPQKHVISSTPKESATLKLSKPRPQWSIKLSEYHFSQ